MNVERRKFCVGCRPRQGGSSQSRNGEPGSDAIDKIGSRDLPRAMGKRSPHEATCPRIASEFRKGRRMFAIKLLLPGSDRLTRAVRRVVRSAWRHFARNLRGRANFGGQD